MPLSSTCFAKSSSSQPHPCPLVVVNSTETYVSNTGHLALSDRRAAGSSSLVQRAGNSCASNASFLAWTSGSHATIANSSNSGSTSHQERRATRRGHKVGSARYLADSTANQKTDSASRARLATSSARRSRRRDNPKSASNRVSSCSSLSRRQKASRISWESDSSC